MKQFRKYFKVVFLIAVVGIIAFLIYRFLIVERLVSVAEYDEIKTFAFNSVDELDQWDEKKLSRHETEYSLSDQDSIKCVKAVSENSASALFYRQSLKCERRPFISWDWKIEEFPEGGSKEDLKNKESFDFAAQMYVVFYARFLPKAKAIQYVWTKEVPKDTVVKSPYTKNVKVVVLESGVSGEWRHEERDVSDDYMRFFEEPLKKDVMAISFMTDSDSTDSRAVAYYKNVSMGYLGNKEGRNKVETEVKLSNI